MYFKVFFSRVFLNLLLFRNQGARCHLLTVRYFLIFLDKWWSISSISLLTLLWTIYNRWLLNSSLNSSLPPSLMACAKIFLVLIKDIFPLLFLFFVLGRHFHHLKYRPRKSWQLSVCSASLPCLFKATLIHFLFVLVVISVFSPVIPNPSLPRASSSSFSGSRSFSLLVLVVLSSACLKLVNIPSANWLLFGSVRCAGKAGQGGTFAPPSSWATRPDLPSILIAAIWSERGFQIGIASLFYPVVWRNHKTLLCLTTRSRLSYFLLMFQVGGMLYSLWSMKWIIRCVFLMNIKALMIIIRIEIILLLLVKLVHEDNN